LNVIGTNPTCSGNNGQITATGTNALGLSEYTLQPGATTNTTGLFNNLTAGTYTITYSDATSCSITKTIALISPSSATWSFAHNLGAQYPVFTIYDQNNRVIIPANIEATNANTATITFASAVSGSASAVAASGFPFTGSGVVSGSFTVTGSFNLSGSSVRGLPEHMILALSDESTTNLTTGTSRVVFRAPYAMFLYQIPRASVSQSSSSGLVTVDINENGTSILGVNKLSIDAGEKTSTTAATATTLADTSIADDAEITFDIDSAGTGARGLKVILYYQRV
jgi:hypothetical protein